MQSLVLSNYSLTLQIVTRHVHEAPIYALEKWHTLALGTYWVEEATSLVPRPASYPGLLLGGGTWVYKASKQHDLCWISWKNNNSYCAKLWFSGHCTCQTCSYSPGLWLHVVLTPLWVNIVFSMQMPVLLGPSWQRVSSKHKLSLMRTCSFQCLGLVHFKYHEVLLHSFPTFIGVVNSVCTQAVVVNTVYVHRLL